MRVVLDTTELLADPWFRSPDTRILLSLAEAREHVICVPELVIDEAANQYGVQLTRYRVKLEKAVQEARRLTPNRAPPGLDDEEITSLGAEFRKGILSAINRTFGTVLPYPQTLHSDLVKRRLDKRKPFDSTGKAGYRDSLIWNSILELLHIDSNSLAFVTHNTSDFGDGDDGLHPDLIEDLVTKSLPPESVEFYGSVHDFVAKRIRSTPSVMHLFSADLAGEHPLNEAVTAALETLFQDDVPGTEIEPYSLGLEPEIQSSSISQVVEHGALHFDAAIDVGSETVSLSFSVIADVEIDVFVEKDDWYSMDPGDISIWDSDLNEHYVGGEITKELEFQIHAIIAAESQEVTAIEIVEILPVEGEQSD